MKEFRRAKQVLCVCFGILGGFFSLAQFLAPLPGGPRSELVKFHIEFTAAAALLISASIWICPKPVNWFWVLKTYVITFFAIILAAWILGYFANK